MVQYILKLNNIKCIVLCFILLGVCTLVHLYCLLQKALEEKIKSKRKGKRWKNENLEKLPQGQ